MKAWGKRLALALALVFVYVSIVNASWLASTPRGSVKLIANHAAAQQVLPGASNCAATRIEPPLHHQMEDTQQALYASARLGAQVTVVHVQRTKDEKLVLFPDATLDCRTDGKGRVADHMLAELKALDAGYGYTADGGRTFPLRGTGKGAIPSLDEVLAYKRQPPLLFELGTAGPDLADALLAVLAASGRDVAAKKDAFRGTPATLARIRAKFPQAWTWDEAGAAACGDAYVVQGWLGITPEACRGQTLAIPLGSQLAYAGWPNKLLERMEAVGAHVVVVVAAGDGGPRGLDLPEQLGKIPSTFNGYVWVDDIYTVGPALRPDFNKRTAEEDAAVEARWQERRKAWE